MTQQQRERAARQMQREAEDAGRAARSYLAAVNTRLDINDSWYLNTIYTLARHAASAGRESLGLRDGSVTWLR